MYKNLQKAMPKPILLLWQLAGQPADTGAALLACCCCCCCWWRTCSCASSLCRNCRACCLEMGSTLLTRLEWLTPYTLSASCTICRHRHTTHTWDGADFELITQEVPHGAAHRHSF